MRVAIRQIESTDDYGMAEDGGHWLVDQAEKENKVI
jgi:hypothetical protein